MSVGDQDQVLTVLGLVGMSLALVLVALGLRTAVSRRVPALWARVLLRRDQRSQPVRIGGAQAMSGAALLLVQATYVVSVPYAVGIAMFAVALLLIAMSLAWYLGLRH